MNVPHTQPNPRTDRRARFTGRTARDRKDRFAILTRARRVWAVAAIHGEADRLESLHENMWPALEHGDRLVYLGNMLGWGAKIGASVDRLLAFRRAFMARPGVEAADIAYLRGSQEEMWQKLLQLQFARTPKDVLRWMVDQGAGATLGCYGGAVEDGFRAAAEGPLALARWTNRLRRAMNARPGHEALIGAVRRAAFTDDGALLFVHAGLDSDEPLDDQGDILWWGGGFTRIKQPYQGYRTVVRGFDRSSHAGIKTTAHTATVDGGCGFGGPLLAACFDPSGNIVDLVEGGG